MFRFLNLFVSITLVSLVCINGLTSDVYYIELDVVKASSKPMKVRPIKIEVRTHITDRNRSYAYAQLAVPYIKDEKIRKKVAAFTWCGTPTWQYFSKHPRPTETELRMEAALSEARMSDKRSGDVH